ncbi:unnamed protein product [Toxocara canis]|uniref:Transposase n=1 Tax=Toxocara canis TaxID=6265 RepID=A0A183U2A4_TOXCA|nr:unnamed protein product [Toxocara canis]
MKRLGLVPLCDVIDEPAGRLSDVGYYRVSPLHPTAAYVCVDFKKKKKLELHPHLATNWGRASRKGKKKANPTEKNLGPSRNSGFQKKTQIPILQAPGLRSVGRSRVSRTFGTRLAFEYAECETLARSAAHTYFSQSAARRRNKAMLKC